MVDISGFEEIPVGMDCGVKEVVLDDEYVRSRTGLNQWQDMGLVDDLKIAIPGATIVEHARMKFEAIPALRVSIWAKSEQEFLKPMIMGSTVYIRGRVADKYVKRGKQYLVTEFETLDENGKVLLRSRETGVYVE